MAKEVEVQASDTQQSRDQTMVNTIKASSDISTPSEFSTPKSVLVKTHVPAGHNARDFQQPEAVQGPVVASSTPLKLWYTPVKSLEQLQTESELTALNIERLRSFTPSWHAVTALQRADSAREYEQRKKKELNDLKQRLVDSYSAIAGLEKTILERELDFSSAPESQRKLGILEQLQRMLRDEQIHNAELQNQVDMLEQELAMRLTKGVERGSPISEEQISPFPLRDMTSFAKAENANTPAASLRNNTLHLLNVWENKALARNAELLSRFGPVRQTPPCSSTVGARVLGWRCGRKSAQSEFRKLPSVVTWFTKHNPEKSTEESTPERKWPPLGSPNDTMHTTASSVLSRNTTPKVLTRSPFSASPFSPFASKLKDEAGEPAQPTPPARSLLSKEDAESRWASKPSVVTWAERRRSSDIAQKSEQSSRTRHARDALHSRPSESGEYPLAFLTLRPSPQTSFDGDCSRLVLDVPFAGEEATDLNKIVRAMEWGGWPSSGGGLNPRRVVAERVLGGMLKVEVRIEESGEEGQLSASQVAIAMEDRKAEARARAGPQPGAVEAQPSPPPPQEEPREDVTKAPPKAVHADVAVQASIDIQPPQPPPKAVKTVQVQTDAEPQTLPRPTAVEDIVTEVRVQRAAPPVQAVPPPQPAPPAQVAPPPQPALAPQPVQAEDLPSAPGCKCVIS